MSVSIPKRLPTTTSQSYASKSADTGMNTLAQPERLGPQSAVNISNLLWDGGSLTTRPGMTGVLTSAHAAKVYLSKQRYMLSSGVARIPYSTGGKVYYYEVGATAGVEITKTGPVSFAFTSASVRYAIAGKWLYFIDSANTTGSLWRVNLESTTVAEEVRGLTSPTITPYASIREGGLLSNVGALTWSNSVGSATAMIPTADTNFQGATGFWEFAGASAANIMDANGLDCVELDAVSGDLDYVLFDKTYGNPDTLPALPAFGSTVPGLGSVKRRICNLEFTYAATENSGGADAQQSVRVVLSGTDTNGYMFRDAQLDETTPLVRLSPANRFRTIADFRNVSAVTHLQMRLESPTATGANGCDVNQIILTVPDQTLAVATASGTATVSQGSVQVFENTLYTDGLSAWAAFGSNKDLSGMTTVVADIVRNAAVSSLSLQFGAKTSAGWFWSDVVSVTSQQDVVFDISAVAHNLTTVTDFAFRVVGDLTVANLAVGGSQALFTVANLRSPGNLTPGLSVAYVWTQVKASGTSYPANVSYEGGGSPFSNAIEATSKRRRATIRIKDAAGTAPTLDSATTHLAFYRLGGATPDGDTRATFLALVPIGADATSPASTTADQITNQYFWDVSEWTFYDNFSDDDLTAAEVYQVSRDMIPLGGTAIAHYGGRLWLARYDATRLVNDVYGSWLIDGVNDFPYMSEATDPTDPELATKGLLLRLGGTGSGDRAVAFSSSNLDTTYNRGGSLMVLRQSAAPSIISGDNPGNFILNPSTINGAGGCLSPMGVENVNGNTFYLSARGIVDGLGSSTLSASVQKLLSLNALGLTRYSEVFMCHHDERLWCIVPGSGSTDGEAFVFDTREGMHGWSRITGYAGLGFTSACSLSGGLDGGDLYIGGRDGQIYKMGGTPYSPTALVDKATPAGTSRAITWSYKTRRFGQMDTQTRRNNSLNRVRSLFVDIYAGSAFTLTWAIGNEKGESATSTFAQPAGRTTGSEIREIPDVRAMTHDITLSGATTNTTTIHSVILEIDDLGETR